MRRKLKILLMTGGILVLLGCTGVIYVKTHPIIFNESFLDHPHCIKQAVMQLLGYAKDHGGKFPSHPGGYGDALLTIPDACFEPLTGPCYSADVFYRALRNGTPMKEEDCGRVYVQGLTDNHDSEIAILFDKLPTPGDHCHLWERFYTPYGREVLFLGGHTRFIPESEWPGFAKDQIEKLVAAGISRDTAVRYYSQKPKDIREGFYTLFGNR